MLGMEFGLGTLWDEYGIVGDVTVSCFLLSLIYLLKLVCKYFSHL